jgi:hypothetical protein
VVDMMCCVGGSFCHLLPALKTNRGAIT